MHKLTPLWNVIARVILLSKNIMRLLILAITYSLDTLVDGVRRKLRFSITFKTTVLYAVIVFNTLVVMIFLVLGGCIAYLWQETLRYMETEKQIVERMIFEYDENARNEVKRYADAKGILVTYYDGQGRMLFTTMDSSPYPIVVPSAFLEEHVGIDANQYLWTNFAIGSDESRHLLQLAKSMQREKQFLTILAIALATYLIFAMILIMLRGRSLKRMLQPIDTMSSTARTISAGALDTRLEVGKSYDELKDLAEAFNEMLNRLQAAYAQQQRFVSDASHELRTPIAVIQGYANMLRRWGKDDKAVLEESIAAIVQEAEHMKNLVEKLLFVARADMEGQQLYKTDFMLDELVEEVRKETCVIDTNHVIESTASEGICINADRGLIKQVLRVCVDNSRKFTPAGGRIAIHCTQNGNRAIIRVKDTGAGICPEDLSRIFDRFYKADVSRSRESGGAGLGLAIAKWIVEIHGGSIVAKSQPGDGTMIEITLPIARA